MTERCTNVHYAGPLASIGNEVLLFVSTSDLSQHKGWPDVQVVLLPTVWNTPVLATFGYTQQVRYTARNTGEILVEHARHGHLWLNATGEIYCMEHE